MSADPSVLATSLTIPRIRANAVARPRLVTLLSAGLNSAHRLVLITAPAGFGKTTLLSTWAITQPAPVAWLSLDHTSNDPVRFWTSIIAACRMVNPTFGADILTWLQSTPSMQAVVTRLINALAEQPAIITLVLDDYHLITSQSIHAAISTILDQHLPMVRIIIATRADPPLPLARWRACDQLTEIRAGDLRFTAAESGDFFSRSMGLELSIDDLLMLEVRTEGWIAGLQLAALSMQRRAELSVFIRTFSGGHRDIVDYLTEEVLRNQSAETQQFLLHSSILERLSGPLCDALTGRNDGQAMLEQLERAQLFLIPLDDQRTWFRYHPLFAEFLRSRLYQLSAEHARAIRQRASDWLATHGCVEEAIEQALASADNDRAAALLDPQAQVWMRRGESATILAKLRQLPEATIRRNAGLCLWYGWALALIGELDSAECWVAYAEARLAGDSGHAHAADSYRRNAQGQALAIRSLVARLRGNPAHALQLGQQALDYIPMDNPGLHTVVSANLAMSHLAHGDFALAEAALYKAQDIAHTTRDPFMLITTLMHKSSLHMLRGELYALRQCCEQALALAAGLPQMATLPHLRLGWLEYQCNHLSLAQQHLTTGLAQAQASEHTNDFFHGHVTMALVQQAQGHITVAEQTLTYAKQVARAIQQPKWLTRLRAWQARLQLYTGAIDSAIDWAQETGWWWYEPGAPLPDAGVDEALLLTLCRLLIAQATTESLRHAQRILAWCRNDSQRRTASLIEISMLHALLHQKQGKPDQALVTLKTALALAQPQGYVRLFIDEGLPLARLLARAERSQPNEFAAYVLANCPRKAEADGSNAGLLEPLNTHEVAILRLLAKGHSNPAIARERVLAVSTVRWYVKHIYLKLGVHNRTQAADRARELHLL